MLNKCANPTCANRFRSLRSGRLFQVESPTHRHHHALPEDSPDYAPSPTRRLEYFWLCQDCSTALTLIYDPGSGITVVPAASRPPAALDAALSTNFPAQAPVSAQSCSSPQ
jgi:hypothetical protein